MLIGNRFHDKVDDYCKTKKVVNFNYADCVSAKISQCAFRRGTSVKRHSDLLKIGFTDFNEILVMYSRKGDRNDMYLFKKISRVN